jgi:hypothetical protein
MADELKYKVSIETDRITPEQLIDPNAIPTLVSLNKEIESYKAALKELSQAEKEQGTLNEEQRRQQEELKLALKDTQSEYRNVQKGIQTVDQAVKTSTNTYKGLVEENKALMQAMRNVPLDDTTGQLQRLQAQYNANNERLKEFDKSIGNHQRNVGNYTSTLDTLGGALSSIPGPIGSIVSMFQKLTGVLQGMTTTTAAQTTVVHGFTAAENTATVATAANTTAQVAQATAVQASATAIGFDTQATVANTVATTANTGATAGNAVSQGAQAASTGAATAATGALTVAQRVLNAVMKANPILLVVAAIAALYSAFSGLQPVMDRIRVAVAAISSAFTFLRDTVYNFLTGEQALQRGFVESIRLTIALEEATIRLRDARISQTVRAAEAEMAIAKLRLAATDETNSIQERIRAIKDAIEVEKSAAAERIEIANTEFLLEKEKQAQYKSTAEDRQRLAELEAKVISERKNQFVTERTLLRQLNRLQTEQAKDEKAILDEQRREQEKTTKELERQLTQRRLALAAYRDAVRSDTESIEASIRKADEAYISGLQDLQDLDLNTARDSAVLDGAFALGEELGRQTVDQAVRLGDQMAALEARQAEELRQRKLFYLSLEYTEEEAAQMSLTDMTIRHAQERADAELAIQQSMIDQQVMNLTNLGNIATNLGTAMFGKNKAIAVAQAIIDTYAAANSAMKSTPGGALAKSLAVAAVIAKGLANVRAITSTKIGSGAASGGDGGGNMLGMTVSNAGTLMPSSFQAQGMGAMTIASTAAPTRIQAEQPINIDASVDQRGLAIAVRRGEQDIRSQQITFV